MHKIYSDSISVLKNEYLMKNVKHYFFSSLENLFEEMKTFSEMIKMITNSVRKSKRIGKNSTY